MNRIYFLPGIVGLLVITACNKKKTEINYDEPAVAETQSTVQPQQAPSLEWHMGAEWQKQAASDGITAASYSQGAVRLTFTPLQGMAGGPEANVQRWRQQAGLPPFSPEELKTAITELQTGVGVASIVKVATSDAATQQIFGAILPFHGTTWFVKMMGPYGELTDAKWQEFQTIIKALHPSGSH